ncbi:metallophosphoesterase [Dyella agri]|uniref:Metallophosphoesterase n=1 Tax=Dyella agri TaxID=1926869 RepID=A0ABW8KB37_9GAMM
MAIDRRSFLKAGLLALAPLASRAAAFGARPSQTSAPLFSFGVAADIQYADKATAGARHYRDSLAKLDDCLGFWNAAPLDFVIQLGDLVDTGGLATLDTTWAAYARARAKSYSALGNHDFVAPRDQVIGALHMPSAYYSFKVRGWRFVVLDGMNVSIDGGWPKDDAHFLEGQKINAALEQSGAPIAGEWNGAVGEAQRHWLAGELAEATAKREKVVVFCHLPTLPGSCQPDLLLWDHDKVVELLDACPTLVSYMCGHDHHGGYAERNGVHYMTFPGMVEHAAKDSSFIVDVHADQLVVRMMSGWERRLAFPAKALQTGATAKLTRGHHA